MWLIATHNGYKVDDRVIPPVDINQYPAVKAHLDCYWDKIAKRDDKGVTPYNLRNCAYMEDFSKQKIVYREISQCMDACMVEPDIIVNNKCYFITGHQLEFLISVFNSTLFNKMILQNANITGGKGNVFLNNVRIPIPSIEFLQKIAVLYQQRFESDNIDSIDREIDSLIFKLYGLSDPEIHEVADV